MSLTFRAGADGDDNLAINIELAVGTLRIAGKGSIRVHDLGLSEIVGSGIDRGPDPDPNPAAVLARLGLLLLPVIPSNQLLGPSEHLGIIARIVHAAVGRGVGEFLRPNVLAQAHFVCWNPDLVGTD